MRSAMTDAEKDAYREVKRTEAEARLDVLLSQEGWQIWLRLRRRLHTYSWGNQVLIAIQASHMGFEPTVVKAAWKWKLDGYHPAKGSSGLYIWVRISRRRKDKTWFCCGQVLRSSECPSCGKADGYFKIGATFDASQVRSFETGEAPQDTRLPALPIEGDEYGWLLQPLADVATEQDWCSTVKLYASAAHGEGGWFRPADRAVQVNDHMGDEHLSPNRQVRTLIHELAHALGVTSFDNPGLSYADCEVAVECVSYIVASSIGLDTSGEAIPYLASWGGEDAREKVRSLAALIDSTAKTIEEQVALLVEQHTAVLAA